MATSSETRGSSKQEQTKENKDNLRQLTLGLTTSSTAEANTGEPESRILAELEKLRKETLKDTHRH